MMQTAAAAFKTPTNVQDDLFFKCDHCGIPLVVDGKAAGMTLKCERCGQPTTVPRSSPANDAAGLPAPVPAERAAELQRHLKENESQRTEINGCINQLSIQLHRWQLRLQTLNERNKELTGEIAGVSVAGDSQPPG
jgi:transcription elongation factor Elf1